MHKSPNCLLETQFMQATVDLDTYWKQVVQARFADLVLPLQDKETLRLQKGLARVTQSHTVAMLYGQQLGAEISAEVDAAKLNQAQRDFEMTLGYDNV